MADTKVVETHEDEAPESQEHVQAMIDKAERVQSVPREDGKPKWLPDKFENPEDLAEAYSQLEQKLSSGSTPVQEEQEETPQLADINEVTKAMQTQGLDFAKYATEYAQQGEISAESYDELAKGGMTAEVVDTWIAGQAAIANQITERAYESVGGQKEYNDLVEWAKTSLPESDIDSFNRAIENTNTDDVLFAIKSLHARKNLEVGETPTLLQGDTGGKSSSSSYKSVTQLTKAMQDPRYQNDPAYRDEVTEKLAQSSIM
tara:strand:+ start:23250 stop:24029 length:780 start_codon:yes stop_codon:yes gene_type:complete